MSLFIRNVILVLLITSPIFSMAGHISGGEIHYTLVGQSSGEYTYNITLKLYRLCDGGRQINNSTVVSIFNRATNERIRDIIVPLSSKRELKFISTDPCITNPPTVCYEVGFFDFNITLPPSANGYIVSSQVIFRVNNINNLQPGYGNLGATYTAEIPGTLNGPGAPANNSAEFTGNDLVLLCSGSSFSYSFEGRDADGDTLRYRFCPAFNTSPGSDPDNQQPPSAPPYDSVPYGNGYQSNIPLGKQANINAVTGLISGITPQPGVYIISVCIDEVRGGKVIASQRKDLQVRVTNCTLAAALLPEIYYLCDADNSLQFSNLSTSPLITSYNWRLQNAAGNNVFTSTQPTPSFTFADTGRYTMQLFINENKVCSDSTSANVLVYPGTKASFSASGSCLKNPVNFKDESTLLYGNITNWLYDFGEAGFSDTSNIANPSFLYSSVGNKVVTQFIETSKGCKSTIQKSIEIKDKPSVGLLFSDTLICNKDTLQLLAGSPGNYKWYPAARLINPNTKNPRAFPAKTTRYYVEYAENGCDNIDSVLVNVVDSVSLTAMGDTTICQGDHISLRTVSNALSYRWSPAILFSNPSAASPFVTINQSTAFMVSAAIGACYATRTIDVRTVPYPFANAGNDTVICFGTQAILRGMITGTSYLWSPSASNTQSQSLTRVVLPVNFTRYVLAVYDTLGCPKPFLDSVTVSVLPKVLAFAGNDTSVVINQPLQLTATGGNGYQWAPARFLSNSSIANPVAIIPVNNENDIRYSVRVSDAAGCSDTSSLLVKVFNTKPGVFVPTAFTPNNDGLNEVLKPVIAGLQNVEYFAVFNRWGQRVFHSQNTGKGWDGTINGTPQPTGSFVWMFKAKDFTGKPYVAKGVVTLLR